MRIAWLTDIHLNFVTEEGRDQFAQTLAQERSDVVLISGDIAEAPTLQATLESLTLPGTGRLLYVLGNHDFYHGRVDEVRDSRRRADATGTYLHGANPVFLNDETCVVGVDGWADGRLGRPYDSELIFTDWAVIDDFKEVDAVSDVEARLRMVRALADESASCLEQALDRAVSRCRTILVVTHVPPFPRPIPPDKTEIAELWIPWLVCKATGDKLLEFARRHPDVQFEVLAGHVHVEYEVHPLPNLLCRVGSATYRAPRIQRVWELNQRSKS